MSVATVLGPLFAQVLLVFILAVLMGARRRRAIRLGEVQKSALIGDANAWPKAARLAANAFHNQFEFPVLFYVLTAIVLITRTADPVFVALAWLFVVLRYAHACIHVTSNRMPHRFFVFIAGLTVLMLMWVRSIYQVFLNG